MKYLKKPDLAGKKGVEKLKNFGLNVIESFSQIIESKPPNRAFTGNFLMTLVREFREVSQDWKQNEIKINAEIKDLDKNEVAALILIWGCAFSSQVLKINNISLEDVLKIIDNDDITKIANGETTPKHGNNKKSTPTHAKIEK